MKDAKPIAGMTPWVCTYMAGGARYGIVLYATDVGQLEADWPDVLAGFTVEGELIATGKL